MSYELKSVFASLPHMERGVAKVLGGDPKGNNFLYTNGKSVIIRNIEVRRKEYLGFSDERQLCLRRFGAVFLWDSGSSVGEIVGHSKIINSVDIKQTRPYRLVTGSDDNCTTFLEGPPFKFKCTISDHSRFVNCVRFSPDGNCYASAGADGQIFLYDGKTGEKLGSLGGEKAHDGGIYAVSWSPDSTQLISASGDKTVRLWDVGSGVAVSTFNLGSDVQDQQLGCLWLKNHLLSVSLSGYINYLDRSNPDRPLRTIKGHTKSIQCLTVHKADGRSSIYSASHDGHINILHGENEEFVGKGHSNLVSRMTVDESEHLVTCSMDDTVRYTDLSKRDASDVVKMDMQPKCVSVGPGGLAVTVCIGQLVLLKDKKKLFTLDSLGYEPESVAVHPGGGAVAVGGADGKVRLYAVQGNTLKDDGKVLEVQGPVTDMSYSQDGAFLAVTDEKKVITVFTVADGYTEKSEFYGHHAKVVCLSWSPDNEHFATGGMDMMLYVWTVSDPDKRIKIPDAHRLHHVSGLTWLNTNTLVTTSHDACVKQWTLRI
uniref:WD repeat domain 1 n=1 Tax=Sinocyclocheilus grahami TaxID=75366 RepID=A0A672MQI3_SINGR